MNIFVLDESPIKAAQYLCNRHVVKMALETAQILCSVANLNGYNAPYKTTHAKHSVTKWAGESISNYVWLTSHGLEICNQYTLRYGKIHKCQVVIEWCRDNVKIAPNEGLTPFVQAMDSKYKSNNAVSSYRNYYIGEKAYFAKWKHPAQKPEWWPYNEEDQRRLFEENKLSNTLKKQNNETQLQLLNL